MKQGDVDRIPDPMLVAGALDGMCVGLVLTDASSRLTWANRSARSMLGLDEDCRGRALSQLLRDVGMAQFWQQSAEGADVVMGDVDLHWPAPRRLKVNASRCFTADGSPLGRALLFCDVTQERQLQLRLSAEATERLLRIADAGPGSGGVPHAGLTERELRILRLVARGLGNKDIAREVRIATTTVRTHLKHVYDKIGLASRSEAISYALRHGLQ